MAAKSLFIDDMHPRSFSTEKKQFGKITAVVPKPTLPGASIIVDKSKFASAAPKKSFLKWKQQHEALFEPKRFLTTNQATAAFNKRKMVPLQDTPTVNPKFELDFHKEAPVQQVKQENCQQFENDCNKYRKNFPGNVKPEFQSMMAFSQQNRVARSEATRFDVPLEGHHNNLDDGQANACGCRCVAVIPSSQDENPWPIQNDHLEKNEGQQLDLQLVDSSKKTVSKSVSKEVLVNIVEEQIEIVQQQKHILMQQNEIFNLQYQIEKLLLMNNGLKNASPAKQLQCSPIRKCITSSPNVQQPPIEANGTMQSVVNSPNSSPQSRKSIGVMTSFHGNVNEVWSPNANQNLASEQESHKDTMLERINKIIQNSPPMINYRVNNANCRVSPKQTDINISSQTLIYKTSTRNNISMNDPKIADRSFALHLLDMKYRPETPSSSNANRYHPQHETVGKTKRLSSKSAENDFVHSNISPDKYDYLIRHGLLNN